MEQRCEFVRVHGVLEGFRTIDGHHRDAQAVLAHQSVRCVDVDLLQIEPGACPGFEQHGSSVVAQVTTRTRVQHDLRGWGLVGSGGGPHRCLGGYGQMREGEPDDLELHRSLSAGDRGAFDDLYRRYAASAYGLAYRITGQQVLAQDVVHDAFMALWRAPEAFDPARGAFRTL